MGIGSCCGLCWHEGHEECFLVCLPSVKLSPVCSWARTSNLACVFISIIIKSVPFLCCFGTFPVKFWLPFAFCHRRRLAEYTVLLCLEGCSSSGGNACSCMLLCPYTAIRVDVP